MSISQTTCPLARRTFLEYCALAAGATHWMPWRRIGSGVLNPLGARRVPRQAPDAPDPALMLTLGQRAVEAAVAAGAAYADVRVTHTATEHFSNGWRHQDTYSIGTGWSNPAGSATHRGGSAWYEPDHPIVYRTNPRFGGGIPGAQVGLGVGVRAFVQGYWGFAASPYWTTEEAARLGQEAASQASDNAHAGGPRVAELGTIPIVRAGQWVMPGIDPFSILVDEKLDWLQGLLEVASQASRYIISASLGFQEEINQNPYDPLVALSFWRETRVFASSEGASTSQVRFRCLPVIGVTDRFGELIPSPILALRVGKGYINETPWGRGTASWSPDAWWQRGWESLRDLDKDALVAQLVDHAKHQAAEVTPSAIPVQVGRYDIVFSAQATAQLVTQSLGSATELDRALGYEANATGTSYLGPDPLQYLGTPVAASGVTLTANRTMAGALATTAWDDDGVAAQAFPLVTDGVLVDYQTTREQAAWLAPWYAKHGMAVQSRGCAMAETALDCPLQMRPNLVLSPGRETVSEADLIKDTKHGVYVPANALSHIDYQCRTGFLHVPVDHRPVNPDNSHALREIVDGKLGRVLVGAAVTFSAPTLWHHVVGVGGAATAETTVATQSKGQPRQAGVANVTAVPMKVTDCAVINYEK